MKIKILIILIIISSLISGLFWAYIFTRYFGEYFDVWINNSNYQKSLELLSNSIKSLDNSDTREIKNITITDLQTEITNIAKDISPSVVSIVIQRDLTIYRQDPWGFFDTPVGTLKQTVWWGTGFFINKDWIILTNKHVISDINSQYIVITSTGKEYSARVIATDPLTDLAVIQIDKNEMNSEEITPLEIISTVDEVDIWEFAIAIWNALAEFQNSVTLWVISGKNRSIESTDGYAGIEKLSGLLQTDAAINPGNSGWPLVNLDWKVVGINTAIASGGQGLGFAISLSQSKIDYILKSIDMYGEIKRPFIWIIYMLLTPGISQELGLSVDRWAYIPLESSSVVLDWPAYNSGINTWEIILEIDWKIIDLNNDLNSIIQNKIPGEKVILKVMWIDWVIREVEVVLWEG